MTHKFLPPVWSQPTGFTTPPPPVSGFAAAHLRWPSKERNVSENELCFGLENFGNTCYCCNSVLQVLISLDLMVIAPYDVVIGSLCFERSPITSELRWWRGVKSAVMALVICEAVKRDQIEEKKGEGERVVMMTFLCSPKVPTLSTLEVLNEHVQRNRKKAARKCICRFFLH
ncbi:hypothetical protein NL676_008078 [Syzygium grande]|nr:hypothetical protein NL676_008078 [Syzygium grande]